MNKRFATRSQLTVLLVLFTAVLPRLSAQAQADEKEKILALERQWCDAYLHADTAFLKGFVVDDFTLTNSQGQVSTKADDLKELSEGTTKYEVFENRDMKVRIYGDAAVVTGTTVVKGVTNGKPYSTEVVFTDTLARINGEWRGVAGHVSKPSH
jgi:ketosteroid isomerase-like protein